MYTKWKFKFKCRINLSNSSFFRVKWNFLWNYRSYGLLLWSSKHSSI